VEDRSVTGIVEFLTARLDEDQATAVAARDKHAGRYPAENDAEWRHTVPGSNGVYTESRSNAVVIGSYEHPLDDETANHIARHARARTAGGGG
jgi:hypothetical protein